MLSDDGKEMMKLFLPCGGGEWYSNGVPIRDGDTYIGEFRLETDAKTITPSAQ